MFLGNTSHHQTFHLIIPISRSSFPDWPLFIIYYRGIQPCFYPMLFIRPSPEGPWLSQLQCLIQIYLAVFFNKRTNYLCVLCVARPQKAKMVVFFLFYKTELWVFSSLFPCIYFSTSNFEMCYTRNTYAKQFNLHFAFNNCHSKKWAPRSWSK
jgi:hypothetical protein